MIEWEDLVLETAERFGGTIPHPHTSAAIANVYSRAPQAVLKTIDRIAAEYEEGGIRSPWGILKSRVQQIQVSEKATGRANDREKAIGRAEQWVRTAGLHYDRETEILDELFGHGGLLEHHDTQPNRDRILNLWTELRPVGELVEHEQEQRLARYQETRAALERIPNQATQGNLTVEELKALAARKSQSVTEAIT